MEIIKINTKFIKPHTPTPQNLKNYNISFIDKQIGPVNFSVVLFYESKPEDDSQLEESLAKVLVQFYPLAGRFVKKDHLVDCSDQGVEYVEAQALDVKLADVVANIDTAQLKALLPDQFFRMDTQLMSVQATHFSCGGIAIAISVSHSIMDVSSLGTLIAAWSNATNRGNKTLDSITPSFGFPLLLPVKERDSGVSFDELPADDVQQEIVFKRLMFDKEALKSLKSKLSPSSNGKTISRVRIASAIIVKALIRLDRVKHGRSRNFAYIQAINMRERTIPPQHKHSCGNFAIPSLMKHASQSEATDLGVQELADLIGDAAQKSIDDHVHMLGKNGYDIIASTYGNFITELSDPDLNVMAFSDWSKFGFYEADFGWGKPIWTGTGPARPGFAILMSNKEGDGIEAWLYLNQSDLPYFDQDEEIKVFTI